MKTLIERIVVLNTGSFNQMGLNNCENVYAAYYKISLIDMAIILE